MGFVRMDSVSGMQTDDLVNVSISNEKDGRTVALTFQRHSLIPIALWPECFNKPSWN